MARVIDHHEPVAGGSTLHPDVAEHICRAYKVASVEAVDWYRFDCQRALWWHRLGCLLMDLLASPDAYLAHIIALKKRKHGGSSTTQAWIADWKQAIAVMRAELLADYPGRGPVWISNEILGMHGNGRPDWLEIRSLIHRGWLPPRPPSPRDRAAAAKRHDPVGHTHRQEAAEELIDSLDHDEQQHWADR